MTSSALTGRGPQKPLWLAFELQSRSQPTCVSSFRIENGAASRSSFVKPTSCHSSSREGPLPSSTRRDTSFLLLPSAYPSRCNEPRAVHGNKLGARAKRGQDGPTRPVTNCTGFLRRSDGRARHGDEAVGCEKCMHAGHTPPDTSQIAHAQQRQVCWKWQRGWCSRNARARQPNSKRRLRAKRWRRCGRTALQEYDVVDCEHRRRASLTEPAVHRAKGPPKSNRHGGLAEEAGTGGQREIASLTSPATHGTNVPRRGDRRAGHGYIAGSGRNIRKPGITPSATHCRNHPHRRDRHHAEIGWLFWVRKLGTHYRS